MPDDHRRQYQCARLHDGGSSRHDREDATRPRGSLMRTERVDLAVVGAGPAGLSAALEANAAGAEVLVIDENDQPGGQIFRQPPRSFRIEDRARLGRDFERGRKLLDAVAAAGIRIENNTAVWNVAPGHLACCSGETAWEVKSDAIVIAAGAYDRPVP